MTDCGDHLFISAGDERRSGQAEQLALETLQQMPAVEVLEEIGVPALAIDVHGTILFANAAFVAMVGRTQRRLGRLRFHQIFVNPAEGQAATAMHAYTDDLVELTHRDGSTVLARMTKSAMNHHDDALAFVVFQDLADRP
jgi:PAS domain S-box-containing protein